MKIIKKQLDKNSGGVLKLEAEEPEDMWHLYNLVAEGDRVTSTTFRKVQKDTAGGVESQKMKLRLCVEVEHIDYDVDVQQLRLRGRIRTENEHVRLGSYHTLEIEQHRAVTVEKERWDALTLERIREAADPAAGADLAAVMVQEGLARLCLVGGSCTVVKAKIESSIPRKRGAAAAGYDKALDKFFNKILVAVERHVDFAVIKCLVIAGPGFTKDEFLKYLELEMVRRNLRPLIENKGRILVAHASSAFKHSLKEVLATESVAARIKDTKAAKEVRALEAFFNMLAEDETRAFYGPGYVHAAAELGAVDVLLLTDGLFRNKDMGARQRYTDLVEGVKEAGGKVHIFSSMHVSGAQLEKMSGIAAILRFPLPDIADADLENRLD